MLKKILAEHGVESKEKSPVKLMNQLVHILTHSDSVENIDQSMTPEEKEVIHYFVVHRPGQLLSLRSLNQRAGSLDRDTFEKGLLLLQRKGILFRLRKSYGDIGYVMPHDLFQIWHQRLLTQKLATIRSKKFFAHPVEKEQLHHLDERLFSLLSFIYRNPISLTKNGILPQPISKQLSEKLSVTNEEHFRYFPIQQSNEEEPKTIHFLLQLAKELQLIENNNQTLQGNQRIKEWVTMQQPERRRHLEAMVRKSFQSSDLFINHIFHSLFTLPREEWISIQELVSHLSEQLKRPVNPEFYTRIEQEILIPLSELGSISYTGEPQKEAYVKMRKCAEEEIEQFYVQPNFEVLVPRQCLYSLRLELEQFATLVQQDQLFLYRISQESVMKGLELGKSITEILQFLEQYSAIPLHESMKATLVDWADRFGALQFYDLRILKCKNVEIANHLKETSEFREWIVGQLDSQHVIVRKDKPLEQVIRQLEQVGYFPSRRIRTDEDILNSEILIGIKNDEVDEEEEINNEFILFQHPEYEVIVELE